MIIRQIRETDLSALSILMDFYTLKPEQAIHNGERQRMQEQGFLLGEYSIEKMRNDISKIFFVAEEEGRIIGYTRVDDGMDLEYQNFDYRGLVDWKSEEYKKKFYEKPQYIIGGLLVAKECGRRGIAGQFLQKVCEKLEQKKAKRVFAFISTAPVANLPSLRFHLKNGFIEIARLRPVSLLGFPNFESVLLMKECI